MAHEKPEEWLEVRSQHFTVITNSNEKTARRIADQFERMHWVFRAAFSAIPIDSGPRIVVLGIQDEKNFRALEPEAYLAKGQATLGGLFLRAPDRNYILMRVGAEGNHPYRVIYHEYTHFLLSKIAVSLPLWLDEGLAEFYQNTDIQEHDVQLGEENLGYRSLLLKTPLLPLPTLFSVDYNSPYYHEENKASIFYAESWALTHYLYEMDRRDNTQRVSDYIKLVSQKLDPAIAATQAFGDLNRLEAHLVGYIRQGSFYHLTLSTTTVVDDATFKIQSLPELQADVVRADFLAHNERTSDALALLDRILQQDPKNALAQETMGYLELRAGHLEKAREWYGQAVKLDPRSYLALYYFASLSMNSASAADETQIESSLRAAIKLNPSFAPAYDRLAFFEATRHSNLEEAHRMTLAASQLDPGNVGYRITGSKVLMEMDRTKDAVTVLQTALKLAKTPEETALLQNALTHAEELAKEREREREHHDRVEAEWNSDQANAAAARQGAATVQVAEEFPPRGAHHILLGKLQHVQCHTPGIDLTLAAGAKTIALHNPNYSKIEYSAFGFTLKGDLNPCHDLEGTTAMVDYVEYPEKSTSAYVFAIEIHK
jgi:tetratricopeptide (TPR) repeat protein